MAYKVIWSLLAREDLRDIVTFIREDNPAVASRVGYTLIKRVDVLVVVKRCAAGIFVTP